MSDKDLRDMWKSTAGSAGVSGYEQSTIERLLGKRSYSVVDKVRRMLQLDIWMKSAVASLLAVDAALYWRGQMAVSFTCLAAIAVTVPLVLFELRVLKQFTNASARFGSWSWIRRACFGSEGTYPLSLWPAITNSAAPRDRRRPK